MNSTSIQKTIQRIEKFYADEMEQGTQPDYAERVKGDMEEVLKSRATVKEIKAEKKGDKKPKTAPSKAKGKKAAAATAPAKKTSKRSNKAVQEDEDVEEDERDEDSVFDD